MTITNTAVTTIDEFKQEVARIQGLETYPGTPDAFAIGIVRTALVDDKSVVLDVRFPTVNYKENDGSAAVFWEYLGPHVTGIGTSSLQRLLDDVFAPFIGDGKEHANIEAVKTADKMVGRWYDTSIRLVWIQDLDAPIASTEDAWLRLHLLSHRKVVPSSINLNGIFGFMQNLAWTDRGPILPDRLDAARWADADEGIVLTVRSIDKFPPLLDYVTPSGVRIADGNRVRLGAYLAPGTTVMQEGFVNFNAGTLGTSMVEGRISQGVVVGEGSDIGGGASIMGTLSGGGTHKVSVGERCLLGANSGLGISIGDDVIVEAGTYITSGAKVKWSVGETPVNIVNERLHYSVKEGHWAYAHELNGISGVVFRRNSLSGALEVVKSTKAEVSLNTELHNN